MSIEEKYELLALPRCTTCGTARKKYENSECCNNPRYITWSELVKREELQFKAMLRAEYFLEQRLLTASEARNVLSEIDCFKKRLTPSQTL